MAQKTAVEWLVEQLTAIGQLQVPQGSNAVTLIIDEAKAMEKDQIENAFNQGFSTPQWDKSKENKSDQYYNENFKSE